MILRFALSWQVDERMTHVKINKGPDKEREIEAEISIMQTIFSITLSGSDLNYGMG